MAVKTKKTNKTMIIKTPKEKAELIIKHILGLAAQTGHFMGTGKHRRLVFKPLYSLNDDKVTEVEDKMRDFVQSVIEAPKITVESDD